LFSNQVANWAPLFGPYQQDPTVFKVRTFPHASNFLLSVILLSAMIHCRQTQHGYPRSLTIQMITGRKFNRCFSLCAGNAGLSTSAAGFIPVAPGTLLVGSLFPLAAELLPPIPVCDVKPKSLLAAVMIKESSGEGSGFKNSGGTQIDDRTSFTARREPDYCRIWEIDI